MFTTIAASEDGSTKTYWKPCSDGSTGKPDAITIHRSAVEHVFGTLKHWMGPAHFLTRTLRRVSTEMSLQVLAYNMKRVMNILGVAGTLKAMKMAGS